jgi:hypothetical protein
MERLSGPGLAEIAAEQLRQIKDKQTSNRRAWAQRHLENLQPHPGDQIAAWRKRHPQAAASERALRKGRAELLDRWKHKNEGTPETHEHAVHATPLVPGTFGSRASGAIARLYKSGALTAEQLGAAVEIAQVAERISADVSVRTASLETRVDVTRYPDIGFHERLSQVRREMAYGEWRRLLRHPAPVLDMLIGDAVGFTVVARRYRIHNRRAKQLLLDALDLWPEILSRICKEVDRKTSTRRTRGWRHDDGFDEVRIRAS